MFKGSYILPTTVRSTTSSVSIASCNMSKFSNRVNNLNIVPFVWKCVHVVWTLSMKMSIVHFSEEIRGLKIYVFNVSMTYWRKKRDNTSIFPREDIFILTKKKTEYTKNVHSEQLKDSFTTYNILFRNTTKARMMRCRVWDRALNSNRFPGFGFFMCWKKIWISA